MSYLTEDEQREKEREQKRRTVRQQIIEHARKPLLFTAFDVKWVPISATIAAAGHHPNMTGALNLYQLQEGELVPVVEARTANAIRCITFGHNRRSGVEDLNAASTAVAGATRRLLAAGDFTGGLSIYDVESMVASGAEQQLGASAAPGGASRLSSINGANALQIKPVISYGQAHASMINCIDGALFSGPPEVATGGRDGAVRVWDLRQAAKPVVALVPKAQGNTAPGGLPGASRDCWSVKLGGSFAPEERVVAAGYDNGDVKIYDMRAGKMRHEFTVSNGVCDLEFDRPDIDCNKLLVSTLEGRVRVYDVRTLHPELGYAYVEERVSTGTIWATRALPQNRDVFISGGAGELTLCKYNYPPERSLKDPATGLSKGVAGTVEELNKVKLGDQPVNSIDWHPGREGLLAASAFDQTLRVMLVTKLGLI